MPKILLMDDSNTQFGSFLRPAKNCLEKHGFTCVWESGKDDNGMLLTTAEALGDRLAQRAIDEECDAVVLDVKWGPFKFDGFDVWTYATRVGGLQLDRRMCVFLTVNTWREVLRSRADGFGFDERQAQFKNDQGFETVIRWLCEQFGIEFSGCATSTSTHKELKRK